MEESKLINTSKTDTKSYFSKDRLTGNQKKFRNFAEMDSARLWHKLSILFRISLFKRDILVCLPQTM